MTELGTVEGGGWIFTDEGEEVIHQLTEMRVRGLVSFGLFLYEFSFGVHSEDVSLRNTDLLIRICIVSSVAEGGVEGLSDETEQISDISETGDLKHLRLLLNHLPV